MNGPRRLSDYPWVVVRISCKLCTRHGCYRLVRLAARYGPEMELDRVLADLACNCPWWRTNPRKYDPRCGARFEDLDRLRPHDVPDAGALHRQRTPAREDLPQRRRSGTPETPGRTPMLSDWSPPQVILACGKCGRRDTYLTEALRRTYPEDITLLQLRTDLSAACPRAIAQAFSDWCAGMLKEPS